MLQLYTAALTILLLVMLVSAFQKPRPKFDEIDVERINIVEASGKLRMTIWACEQALYAPIRGVGSSCG